MGRETLFRVALFVLLISVQHATDPSTVCRHISEEQVKCYFKAGGDPGNFDQRRSACIRSLDEDFNLVMIADDEENSFVQSHLSELGVSDEDELWIGKRAVADLRWDQDNSGTSLDELSWQGGTAPAVDTEGVSIHMTDDGETPDQWEFTAVAPDSTFGYLCEGAAADTMSGYAATYAVEIESESRFFFAFRGDHTRDAAKAACEASDAWLATIESDAALGILALAMDDHVATDGIEIDDQMWIGAYFTDVWRLVNDEKVDYFGGGDLPTESDSCGYVAYDADGSSMAWAQDGDCAAEKDAICELVQDAVPEICMEGGSCYTITNRIGTWEAMNAICEAADGTLAMINDEAESTFLNGELAKLGLFNSPWIWIGAQIDLGEGPWMWINGPHTSVQADTDTDFTWTGTPTDADAEFVVSIQHETDSWGFVRTDPGGSHGFLCEGDAAVTGAAEDITTGEGDATRFYGYFDDATSWFSARQTCREAGAWLANVGTNTELALIGAELAAATPPITATMWVGLYRNDWQWIDESPVVYDHWIGEHPEAIANRKSILVYNDETSAWISQVETEPLFGLCEKATGAGAGDNGDNGLSDGEIAAIAVGSTVAVGAAAGGGGYYAYSKSSGGKVEPNDGGESGEAGEGDKKEEEEEGGDGEQQPEDEAPAEE